MAADSQVSPPTPVDVLVVDDDRDSADTLGLVLAAKGHTVQCAYGGVAALELILKLRPAVVVTDIAMPSFDGMTVAASVNRMALERPPTLIAYSALVAHPDVLRASHECGIVDTFLKPDDLDKLCARVEVALADPDVTRPVGP
jgi:CheY-like chemotaxis protein